MDLVHGLAEAHIILGQLSDVEGADVNPLGLGFHSDGCAVGGATEEDHFLPYLPEEPDEDVPGNVGPQVGDVAGSVYVG